MMITKSYFEKNNTLIFNSDVNTAKNPITELYYGGSDFNNQYTRFIFKLDLSKLKQQYNDLVYPDLNKLTHKLKMTNTGLFDKTLAGKNNGYGKLRSNSFDLIIFPINQFWDEGVGYDYDYFEYIDLKDRTFSNQASNWFLATSLQPWQENGTFSGSSQEILATQHFDNGNENIELDITNYINTVLSGNTEDYGLGIAYDRGFELLETDEYQYVGFFSKYTNTFYEPFLESIYSDPINDNRLDFYSGKLNRLYLYINIGNQPKNLDDTPNRVVIRNSGGAEILVINKEDIKQATKGVYYVEFSLPLTENECGMYYDTWEGIFYNNIDLGDVEMDFEVKNYKSYFKVGEDNSQPERYDITIKGLRKEERILRGDERKIFIESKILYNNKNIKPIEGLEYRLYVKEGSGEYTVIDYLPTHKSTNTNYIILDTSQLIPNEYFIDFKVKNNQEVINLKNKISFFIIDDVVYNR